MVSSNFQIPFSLIVVTASSNVGIDFFSTTVSLVSLLVISSAPVVFSVTVAELCVGSSHGALSHQYRLSHSNAVQSVIKKTFKNLFCIF
jgi:hypothetical protein